MSTIYCGPSNTGGGTGADFNNLLALPNTTGFVRGNEYVCIEGSYGNKTLSTATSGTTTITIRKANAAQDGAVAGYASSLHDGQAVFGTISVATRYWIVDGITRTESDEWTAPTGYGFKATQIYANSNDGHDADFSQFRYIDIGDDYSLVYSGAGEAVYIVFNQSDLTFTRCALHMSTHTLVQAAGAQNITFEYCHFGPGWGKEAIRGGNGPGSGWIIRHNRFWNASQIDPEDPTSGITAEIAFFGDGAVVYDGIAVYGNWFYNEHSGGRNSVVAMGGMGFSDTAANCVVYNNTFAGVAESSVFAMVFLSGSGNIARNNLFYDCADTDVSATTTSDNDVAGADPFEDYASLDLRLSGATAAGFSLSSPYNTDPTGATRGADGTWDVGAYEFDEGGGDETPPQLTSAVIASSGQTITFTFDEAVTIGAGGSAGWAFTMSGGAVTATYLSGSGSTALVYSLSRLVAGSETTSAGLDYTQPGSGIEDAAGNDLASIDDATVTNNSTYVAPTSVVATSRKLKGLKL